MLSFRGDYFWVMVKCGSRQIKNTMQTPVYSLAEFFFSTNTIYEEKLITGLGGGGGPKGNGPLSFFFGS